MGKKQVFAGEHEFWGDDIKPRTFRYPPISVSGSSFIHPGDSSPDLGIGLTSPPSQAPPTHLMPKPAATPLGSRIYSLSFSLHPLFPTQAPATIISGVGTHEPLTGPLFPPRLDTQTLVLVQQPEQTQCKPPCHIAPLPRTLWKKI